MPHQAARVELLERNLIEFLKLFNKTYIDIRKDRLVRKFLGKWESIFERIKMYKLIFCFFVNFKIYLQKIQERL